MRILNVASALTVACMLTPTAHGETQMEGYFGCLTDLVANSTTRSKFALSKDRTAFFQPGEMSGENGYFYFTPDAAYYAAMPANFRLTYVAPIQVTNDPSCREATGPIGDYEHHVEFTRAALEPGGTPHLIKYSKWRSLTAKNPREWRFETRVIEPGSGDQSSTCHPAPVELSPEVSSLMESQPVRAKLRAIPLKEHKELSVILIQAEAQELVDRLNIEIEEYSRATDVNLKLSRRTSIKRSLDLMASCRRRVTDLGVYEAADVIEAAAQHISKKHGVNVEDFQDAMKAKYKK